jgi:rRNA maturation RNase YbeY
VAINFHSDDIEFTLGKEERYIKWIENVVVEHGFIIQTINIIFTSNRNILKINREYLQHNYYTDVITFNYNNENSIFGDIYISIEEVLENSKEYKVDFINEISRVIIHGVLHLLGYDDDTAGGKEEMRKLEDEALVRLELI